MADNPMVKLNRAIATAMVEVRPTGLELLKQLDNDPRMAGHHRLDAVRGHLLEMAGDTEAPSGTTARRRSGRPACRSGTI